MDYTAIISIISIIAIMALLGYYRPRILGKWGEIKVSTILSLLGKDYLIFNDVLIRNGNWTSQIDHIVVSAYGVFVIETKNYKGWIYGGVDQDKWTQNIWGNKTTLSNPIRQNMGHVNALKKILPCFSSRQYKSIIVFSSKADLRTNLPDEYNVIYTWDLLSRIKRFTEVILSPSEIEVIIASLEQNMLTDKETRKLHISNVRENVYRKENQLASGICPRCGGNLVLRNGQYGKFWGCSNYPKCRFTADNK